jgi:hypothetical protein
LAFHYVNLRVTYCIQSVTGLGKISPSALIFIKTIIISWASKRQSRHYGRDSLRLDSLTSLQVGLQVGPVTASPTKNSRLAQSSTTHQRTNSAADSRKKTQARIDRYLQDNTRVVDRVSCHACLLAIPSDLQALQLMTQTYLLKMAAADGAVGGGAGGWYGQYAGALLQKLGFPVAALTLAGSPFGLSACFTLWCVRVGLTKRY